jgi:hypothetical protein
MHGIMATLFVVAKQGTCAFFVGGDAPANCVVFQTSTDAGKPREPAPQVRAADAMSSIARG